MGADAGGAHRQRYLRAVKSISRSIWNVGYRPDSGPSLGDPCRRAYRPVLPYKVGPVNGRETRENVLQTEGVVCAPKATLREASYERVRSTRSDRSREPERSAARTQTGGSRGCCGYPKSLDRLPNSAAQASAPRPEFDPFKVVGLRRLSEGCAKKLVDARAMTPRPDRAPWRVPLALATVRESRQENVATAQGPYAAPSCKDAL
jgi:hypothetical protein